MSETMQKIQDIIESTLALEGYDVLVDTQNNVFVVQASDGKKYMISFVEQSEEKELSQDADATPSGTDAPSEIRGFFDEYRYLSNFYIASVRYNGLLFQNNEAAFQAQKCPSRASEFTKLNPSQAKRLGRRVSLRRDWESVKYTIMKEIVYAKFSQNTALRNMLLGTGNAKLFEENTWGDTIWGTVNGQGRNYLGKILEEVRDELRKELNK